jgi:hypothetical protein
MGRGLRSAAAGRLVALAALGGALALGGAPLPARAAEVALSFGDAPGGNAGGFRIERRKAGAPSFEVIALVGPGVADFVDRGLPAGATYCYRVRAAAAAAASAWSPEVCAEAQEEAPPSEAAASGAPAPAEGAAAGEGAPPVAGASEAAGPAPGSEPGRRIRTSGGWLQVLD